MIEDNIRVLRQAAMVFHQVETIKLKKLGVLLQVMLIWLMKWHIRLLHQITM